MPELSAERLAHQVVFGIALGSYVVTGRDLLNSSITITDPPELLYLQIAARDVSFSNIAEIFTSTWRVNLAFDTSFIGLLGMLFDTLLLTLFNGWLGVLHLSRMVVAALILGVLFRLIYEFIQAVSQPRSRSECSIQLGGSTLGATWLLMNQGWENLIASLWSTEIWTLLGFVLVLLAIARRINAKQVSPTNSVIIVLGITLVFGSRAIGLMAIFGVLVFLLSREKFERHLGMTRTSLLDSGLLVAVVLVPMVSYIFEDNLQFVRGISISKASSVSIEPYASILELIPLLIGLVCFAVLGTSVGANSQRIRFGVVIGYVLYVIYELAVIRQTNQSVQNSAEILNDTFIVLIVSIALTQLLIAQGRRTSSTSNSNTLLTCLIIALMAMAVINPYSWLTDFATDPHVRSIASQEESEQLRQLRITSISEDLPIVLLSYWPGDNDPLLSISTQLHINYRIPDTFIYLTDPRSADHFMSRAQLLTNYGIPNSVKTIEKLPTGLAICVTFEYTILNPSQPTYETMRELCRHVVEFSMIES